MVGVRAALHEPPVLEGEQHLVHRLRGDQRPPGQLGVGQAAAAGQHAQGGVLADGEPVTRTTSLMAPLTSRSTRPTR